MLSINWLPLPLYCYLGSNACFCWVGVLASENEREERFFGLWNSSGLMCSTVPWIFYLAAASSISLGGDKGVPCPKFKTHCNRRPAPLDPYSSTATLPKKRFGPKFIMTSLRVINGYVHIWGYTGDTLMNYWSNRHKNWTTGKFSYVFPNKSYLRLNRHSFHDSLLWV